MMWYQFVLSVAIVIEKILVLSTAQSRDLSEIQYHFTTCGTSGRDGPSFEQCMENYQGINSLITEQGLLFSFNDEGQRYPGAQGFHFPRPGIYNVTVAGAAGGRGVCNTEFGHGAVHEFQIHLIPNYEFLILVGQKGRGPCDTNPNHFLCDRTLRNMQDTAQCAEEWYNYTRTLSGTDATDTSVADIVYLFNGGAGGGGASMIWARFAEKKTFLNNPVFVSAGGGGSPALLNYDVSNTIRASIQTPFNSNERLYQYHLNGRSVFIPILNIPNNGDRGVRRGNVSGAGVGGGFFGRLPGRLETDGYALSQERNFAEGGPSCAIEQFRLLDNQNTFLDTFGGFGGGGGGCGGGGGGGGYTGGSVLNSSNDFPGGGGYSAAFSHQELPLESTIHLSQNDDHGYITIMPADCGCSDGLCVVNNELNSFECMCENKNHTLADNGLDCYRETEVEVQQVWTSTRNGFSFTIFEFSNSSMYIFSVCLSLGLESHNQQDASCGVVFFGEENQPLLVTAPVRSERPLKANILSRISVENITISLSEYTLLLRDPVLVTRAVIVSNADCSLKGEAISMNISTRTGTERSSVDFVQLLESVYFNDETIRSILQISKSQPTSPPSSSLLTGVIAGIAVTIVIILSLVTLGLVGFKLVSKRKKTKYTMDHVLSHTQSETLPQDYLVPLSTVPAVPSHTSRYLDMSNSPLNTPTSQELFKSNHSNDFGLPGDVLIMSANLKLGKVIGEGEFGIVYRSQLNTGKQSASKTVAVKTMKGLFSQKQVDDMISESKKMCLLNHPNVQKLLGVCIDGGPAPYIVMPFMKNGSLLSYLRKNKVKLLPKANETDSEYKVDEVAKQLTDMCLQIAKGMEYLTSKNIVHRDLATRNCMIDDSRVICVSDFGLSENLYTKTYFRQENHTSVPLPLKWTAPESINFGIFSEKTDVWSFGVTCWEVFSAGKIPYPGISALSLPQLLEDGYRMDKPSTVCSDTMYDLMKQCWLAEASKRPCFADIVKEISNDLEAMGDYFQLQPTGPNN